MRNTLIALLFVSFFTLLSINTLAQHRAVGPYNAGIGLRGGFLYGLSLKFFMDPHSGVEVIAGTRWHGYSITGLYEYQQESKVKGLDWFVGFGAHGGTYNQKYFLKNGSGAVIPDGNIYTIGVDGILGLEYRVLRVPFSFSIDFKPFLDLASKNQNFLDAALTIRYLFK